MNLDKSANIKAFLNLKHGAWLSIVDTCCVEMEGGTSSATNLMQNTEPFESLVDIIYWHVIQVVSLTELIIPFICIIIEITHTLLV